MIHLVCLVALIVTIVLYLRKIYSKFTEDGVAHFTPIPLLGNVGELAARRCHLAHSFDKLYKAFPNERFVGRYEMTRPLIVIRDIELVKKITIKDFEHFLDHRMLVDDTVDNMFGRSLFSLRGQEWKDMRSTLSPAFTSSKMRGMVPFMVEVGSQMVKSITKKVQDTKGDHIDLDCKDLAARYTNDVIASCAFGVKVDSHTDENNDFYAMGKSSADFGVRAMLVFLGHDAFPYMMKLFNVKFFSDETKIFFKNLVLSTMKIREERKIIRPDMIHLLMEAKKGKLTHEKVKDTNAGFATVEEFDIGKNNVNKEWSDDDLIAQAVLFFTAGFESISSAMCLLFYELALNPDVQQRLVEEINEHDIKNSGKLDYDSIQSLIYLDMVVSEILRLWPPAVAFDRICTKDYNLGKPISDSKKDYILRKGESILIPVWCYQHDPEYFPDPFKFDPERFSEENKHNIKPFTYAPFGIGPRNCIGSRFALCEIKIMAYQLLRHLEVTPCEKTSIPAQLLKGAFNLRIEGGHWIRFKARKL